MKRTLVRLGLAALVSSALFGCGSGGSDGIDGKDGAPAGPVVTVPVTIPGTNVATLAAADWADLQIDTTTSQITGVTINSPPEVTFTLLDAKGNAVTGLDTVTSKSATATVASYPNVAFSIAKLVPGTAGSPSKWVSYIVTTVPSTTAASTMTRPSTDNTGTLTYVGNGVYKYKFYRDIKLIKAQVDAFTDTATNKKADLGDLTFEPNLTHRVTIQISGNAPGTGSNTANGVTVVTGVPLKDPANLVFDFVPATGKAVALGRDIAKTENCNECHAKLNALGFHGGSRNETQYCVVCHTDQRKFGQARVTSTAGAFPALTKTVNATTGSVSISPNTYVADGEVMGDFPVMIHKIHMGEHLTKKNYNYAGVPFNEVLYPIGNSVSNCLKCHNGSVADINKTAEGDNWKNVPNRLACGSCHDKVNFATGENHGAGGVQTDNSKCASCHTPAAIAVHHASDYATLHSTGTKAGLVNFKYEIKSAAATATDVKVVFAITADGKPVTFLPSAATGVANPLTGFTGSPSFLLAYAKTQDGVTKPIDFNNLGNGMSNAQPRSVSIASLMNTTTAATTGKLEGPDAAGYYTATIVGSSNVFPTDSSMKTVSLQGYFTQISPASGRHALSVTKTVTGETTARRAVVDATKCGNCHEIFEGHGGNRNIGAGAETIVVCTLCHVPGIVASGRGISDSELKTFLANPSTVVESGSAEAARLMLPRWKFDATKTNAALELPQVTNNLKDMIHGLHAGKTRTNPIRIARNRLSSGGAAGAFNLIDGADITFPGILKNCESCHRPGTYSTVPANTLATTEEADNGVRSGSDGGRTTVNAKDSLKQPNSLDKVTTPFTGACVSCHDSAVSIAHIKQNGGQILVTRGTMDMGAETCTVCHDKGKVGDPAVVHK